MKTNAWEVTLDDVAGVLVVHGLIKSYDDPLVTEAHARIDEDEVIGAALAYLDFAVQVSAALSEIEDQLIEANILKQKKFELPN